MFDVYLVFLKLSWKHCTQAACSPPNVSRRRRGRPSRTLHRATCGLGARNEVRSVAIHIDLKPLSTRAWPTGRTHKFIVDGPCRSNARCSRTMLVIFSSIVSVPELAAAQSFVAFTTIASRAGRTRAARCLLAQHPRHTPCGGMPA